MGKKQIDTPIESLSTQSHCDNSLHTKLDELIVAQSTKCSYRINHNRNVSHKWSRAETQYFYQLLETYGTDFSIMSAKYEFQSSYGKILKNKIRTKKQLLNKYKKQEKVNYMKVNQIFERAWKNRSFGLITKNQITKEKTTKLSRFYEIKCDKTFEKHQCKSTSCQGQNKEFQLLMMEQSQDYRQAIV